MKFSATHLRIGSLLLGSGLLSASSFSLTNFYAFDWVGMYDSQSNGTITRFNDYQSGQAPVYSQSGGTTTYTDSVGGDLQLTGLGKGRSGYLNLGTYATANLTNAHAVAAGNTNQAYQVAGIAGYTTQFTIFGPSLVQNDIYNQSFTFAYDGSTDAGTGVDSHGFIFLHVGTDAAEGAYLHGSGTFTSAIHHFQAGVSNDFQLEMDSGVDFLMDSAPVGSTMNATTDYFHSLKLVSVDVTDMNGNAVNDFGIMDPNGQVIYGHGSVATTPEPCTLGALGIGLSLLAKRRRK